ncbi:PucR family transcriptional regulator [Lentzea tibetensis]|uniref:PucR family transcriptional regulator n=1 Tax=Lentzea tibetensis TaxID=2591470 RepID=A0A563EWX4_9PSEU|nr:PucR family transcriptional regulator [Lentzea tibetensis]TWP52227.1 PucR family transcriptional regulator [Lentzea tibetensis]
MVVQTVSLRAVVARPELGLAVLCGEDQLDRPVRWAHVSELADPTPFLVGQELLMTAGVKFPDDVDRYVAGLVSSGVSAVAFGVMPEYAEVPARLVEECAAQGMPLVAVPPDTPFLAVSQAVGDLLAERQNAELRMLADSQRALTRAAVRIRPVDGTVTALAVALDCWVLLLDANGAVLGRSARAPELSGELAGLARRVGAGTGPRSASTSVGDDHVVLNPVEQLSLRPAILVVGRETALSVAERAVVAVAVAVLSLLRRDADTSRGHPARLAARLLLGLPAADQLALVLDSREYRVIAGRSLRRAPADHELLTQTLGTPLIDLGEPGLRAVVAAGNSVDLDRVAEQGWVVGVSGPVGAGELGAASDEAESLLRSALASGRSQRASELGSVSSLVEPAQAARFAVRLMAPLASGRSARGLVETLRVWLAQHGNWDRSASVLGIHRNSVRHRIRHIERMLGLDLADAGVRADLWQAVHWLPPGWPD